MPALLKGFIDRTLTTNFAIKYTKYGLQGLLKKKKATIIQTMDAPPLYYKLKYKDIGLRLFKKAILKDCGFNPIKIIKIGSVHKSTEEQRKKWLNKIYKLGKKN